MKIILRVANRRLNVSSNIQKIFVKSTGYLFRFSGTSAIIKDIRWSYSRQFF